MPASWYGRDWILRLHAPTTGIPYGVAIAAAGLFVFFGTHWADLIS
jgi:prepilin peptidase CpaA